MDDRRFKKRVAYSQVRAQGVEFRGLGSRGLGFRFQSSGFGARDLGFRLWGLQFMVQGLGSAKPFVKEGRVYVEVVS